MAENNTNTIKKFNISWNCLEDKDLYTNNAYALSNIAENKSFHDKINFHAYWYGNFGRKQAFSLKSFLCTQDIGKYEVHLWLDYSNGYLDYPNNKYLQPLLPYITIRPYFPDNEAKNTVFEGFHLINQTENLAKRSDAFRYLILNQYGGVYFDLDVMFLRDFSPLLHYPFCYSWSNQPYANNALLYLNKNSSLSNYILTKCVKLNLFHPKIILRYNDEQLSEFFIYPSAFFDPIWLNVDLKIKDTSLPLNRFDDFFREFDCDFIKKDNINSYKDFFPGCFTHHWHNQWDCYVNENSYFGFFEKEFDKKLNIKTIC